MGGMSSSIWSVVPTKHAKWPVQTDSSSWAIKPCRGSSSLSFRVYFLGATELSKVSASSAVISCWLSFRRLSLVAYESAVTLLKKKAFPFWESGNWRCVFRLPLPDSRRMRSVPPLYSRLLWELRAMIFSSGPLLLTKAGMPPGVC